ncbi:predicted protein [Streptomyces sp. C]|nr:predicted protein [Streptomyces sp. C]
MRQEAPQERHREAPHLRGRLELLGDELLRAGRGPLTAVVALACSSFLAAGCSGPTPSGSASEEAQGVRAQGLLEKVAPDAPEFVESGLERVADGVHARSALAGGRTYKVSVACVGTGTVELTIGDKAPPQAVPCDGVRSSRPVQDPPDVLPVDITAAAGATGMVAWQITAVPS